jgi:DNA-binding response OmpR family regulator
MKRILIVDDDLAILKALDITLRDAGYETETSTKNGEYVERSLRRRLPDLMILDILLSGHDGRDICKKVKNQEETKGIPVILISAHPNAEKTAFDAGADDFLAKPFNIDDLLAKVQRLVR